MRLSLTVDEVADELVWSATKISRIETGFVGAAFTRTKVCAYDMSPAGANKGKAHRA